MRSCALAVVTSRPTPRAENIASNTTYCTIHLSTLQDATFQTGNTHAAKTALPAPREMVWPLYHGHSYQQLTVQVSTSIEPIICRMWQTDAVPHNQKLAEFHVLSSMNNYRDSHAKCPLWNTILTMERPVWSFTYAHMLRSGLYM
jgi:hypothetical protein